MLGLRTPYELLAPVPFIHLVSAMESHLQAEVAFGSEKTQLFKSLGSELTAGMQVWIYASKTGSDRLKDPSKLQRVCFRGDFGGSTETDREYQDLHRLCPPTARAGDSPWIMLWSVKNLQEVKPSLFFSHFQSAKTRKPLAKEPEGPMLIVAS